MKYSIGKSFNYEEVSVKSDIDLSYFEDLEIVIAMETARELRERIILNVGIGGSIIAAPVLHKGVLYFGCADKNFYAVSTEGKELWRYGTDAQVFATARISEDIVYFGSYDGNFYKLDLNGKLKWRFSTQDKIISIPCIHDNKVHFGSCDGNLYCLDARNGRELWKFPTGGPVASSTIYKGGRVYFGSDDKNYYSVDAENGQLLWRFPTQGIVSCQPSFLHSIYKNIIYFSSYDFNLASFGGSTQRGMLRHSLLYTKIEYTSALGTETCIVSPSRGNCYGNFPLAELSVHPQQLMKRQSISVPGTATSMRFPMKANSSGSFIPV
jgi:outer membrane protein assembly factor BamB